MPELPEVEALRQYLTDAVADCRIASLTPVAVNVLKTWDPPLEELVGRVCTRVERHGKFLDLCTADGPHLVVHLARAGWLRWRAEEPARTRPGRGPLALRLRLADGRGGFDLTEAGTQKRLAVYCVHRPEDVPGVARLGPEPLADAFDVTAFAELLRGRRHRIKGVLRDQSVIAGIGNAYSDEILHAARMSPYRLASDLDPREVGTLYEAMRGTLLGAVERARGLAAQDLKSEKKSSMRVHGRAGLPCPVCGDTVREVSFRDSSLQYCPTCQTDGRTLADRRMSRLLK
ncbi:Fpg/Nei family DNA glycosylase [Streptomyces sp. XM4193]|uniref:Fpg/Nei family DNA glycosylase n=1 Tax=Streptomyces sp. XM4193 TaxID=2929782 RepID=UPI001FF88F3F|nr:DNA-formamidopyrimidine glycosylase family protein [Streptomyces sp. XM4193]MCK1797282.1 Fpg/Nei family DNA glycosylase [Streptomyces sp. XM4193]